ncbi:hypothetical protein [Pseudoalteromonas sp. MMG005]|uniref:hypothetical protein n=1 Tax=Pseudoalteromonas sp. MMG005 TaxID=2822682 RepID=UPI001B39DD37|nr:hypothetical protein [Pseudoalteromonas sp. MMG005]MBQ4844398.1 hypothetical protein [Pseudoalteromonas sp. MMG005]
MRDFLFTCALSLFVITFMEIAMTFTVVHMYEQCVESSEVQMSTVFSREYKFKCEAELVE